MLTNSSSRCKWASWSAIYEVAVILHMHSLLNSFKETWNNEDNDIFKHLEETTVKVFRCIFKSMIGVMLVFNCDCLLQYLAVWTLQRTIFRELIYSFSPGTHSHSQLLLNLALAKNRLIKPDVVFCPLQHHCSTECPSSPADIFNVFIYKYIFIMSTFWIKTWRPTRDQFVKSRLSSKSEAHVCGFASTAP